MRWTDKGGGDFEQAPVGTQVARCIRVIDIGTQFGEYQGKATSARKNVVGWELPNCLTTDGDKAGQPFVIFKFYTASLGEKANLRKDLVNWRGREFTVSELTGFEAKNILGKTCLLSLVGDDKGKTKIGGVMALPSGLEVPPQVNPSVYFSLDEFDNAVFETISKGFKEMIEKSPEYRELINPQPKKKLDDGSDFADFQDDIPF